MTASARIFAGLIAAALWLAPAALTAQENTLTGKALLDALTVGDLTIYFRHARTDWSQRDERSEDLSDCKLQRNLSDEGRDDVRLIGDGFKAAGIPVGEVLSSQYCRCREHAEIAFGRVELREEFTSFLAAPENRERRTAALKKALNTPAAKGNRVIIGHQSSLRAASGIALEEGEAAVFRAGAEAAVLVGRVKPKEWAALATVR